MFTFECAFCSSVHFWLFSSLFRSTGNFSLFSSLFAFFIISYSFPRDLFNFLRTSHMFHLRSFLQRFVLLRTFPIVCALFFALVYCCRSYADITLYPIDCWRKKNRQLKLWERKPFIYITNRIITCVYDVSHDSMRCVYGVFPRLSNIFSLLHSSFLFISLTAFDVILIITCGITMKSFFVCDYTQYHIIAKSVRGRYVEGTILVVFIALCYLNNRIISESDMTNSRNWWKWDNTSWQ